MMSSMNPIGLRAAGMVSGVGLTAASSCAAIRCAIDNFAETHFADAKGEPIIGSPVNLAKPWRGLSKLVQMARCAIAECLESAGKIGNPDAIPLLLCAAEENRPGRTENLTEKLLTSVQSELGMRFHDLSALIQRGRASGAIALELAARMIGDKEVQLCIIAGVDSFLSGPTLAAYEDAGRLLTSQNSNGFIPGEGAAAVLVGRPGEEKASTGPVCVGIGSGHETATIDSGLPLRADGLVDAIAAATRSAGVGIGDLDFRITDSNGEQYWFKEAALALDRCLRNRKELFDIWHPADCIGEVGAAIGPSVFAVALHAARKSYAFGRGPLCHFSSDDGQRMAVVFRSAPTGVK